MQDLTQAQVKLVRHMIECEAALSEPLAAVVAADLYDRNNALLTEVDNLALALPNHSNEEIIKSLENYKKLLRQNMPTFSKPGGPS